MVDLETFSTSSNASILTLGAMRFTTQKSLAPLEKCDTFYRRIIRESCTEVGLQEDDNTLEWWDKQCKEAKHEIFTTKDRVPLKQALQEFITWFGACDKIWSHGASFDVVILENAMKACGLKVPWKFWNIRDTRTLYDVGRVNKRELPNMGLHHALYDCYSQVSGVKKAYGNLRD